MGPQRAELDLVSPAGKAAAVLSRGQGKLVAMAMVLAQIQLLERRYATRSLLLIDDLGAEIDSSRTQRLFQVIAGTGAQVFATSTANPEGVLSLWRGAHSALVADEDQARIESAPEPRVFHVKHGQIGG